MDTVFIQESFSPKIGSHLTIHVYIKDTKISVSCGMINDPSLMVGILKKIKKKLDWVNI